MRWRLPCRCPPALQDNTAAAPGSTSWCARRSTARRLRRTYSLVNAPGEWPLRIVPRVHASGSMSRYLAEELQAPGEQLEVLPPNGSFTPRAVTARRRATLPSPPAAASPLSCRSCARCLRPGAQVLLFYGNSGTRAGDVRGGAAGTEGPAPATARTAFRDEPRAAGGRALQRPAGCGARARVCRALFEPVAVASTSSAGPAT